MKVQDAIPSLRRIDNKENSLLENELGTSDLFQISEMIGIELEQISRRGPDPFRLFAREVLEDILRAKNKTNYEEISVLNFLQFIHCTEIVRYLSNIGMFTECHDWLVYSLSDKLDYVDETVFQIERIREFFTAKNQFILANAIPSFIDWITGLFYYSRHYGGLVDFCISVVDSHSKIIVNLLNNKIPVNVVPISAVNAACHILAWTIGYQKESSLIFSKALENYFAETSDHSVKKLIALQLSVGGAEYTQRSSSDWAELLLSQYSHLLVGHERMQLLSKYYSINVGKLESEWQPFMNSIREYLLTLKEQNPLLLKYEKAKLFGVINGLLLACIENDFLVLANNIVSEFYEIEITNRPINAQLYIICNYNYGVLYTSPSMQIPLAKVSPNDFIDVIHRTNKFLSTTISINNYPDFVLVKPAKPGVPIISEGVAFERILQNHYQFKKLQKLKFDTIGSMVVIPGFQHPIQSMMIKELEATIPICVSFEEPNPQKRIKKILLWCFGTRTSELELSLTRKMFEAVGTEVEAIEILNVKREDFITKYKSADYDLIWVGTHGEYSHFSPHLSTIDIHPDGKIELFELLGLTQDIATQRILFLNICDGATASTINALYDLGFGASLCGKSQDVLSHIWPVEIANSFIYGVLYAHFLIINEDFFIAYQNVVKAFLRGKEFIRELLYPYVALEEELNYYIDKLDDQVQQNIYYWGSGAYYQ